jgi:hypothetical protein
MKARFALLAAPLALLAACSDDDPTIYTLSTGTYAVSDAGAATGADGCGFLDVYANPDKKIDILVSGTTASFNLGQIADTETYSTATINGNSLDLLAEANYTGDLNGCWALVRRTVVGELTANDTAALQLHAEITEADPVNYPCTNTEYAGNGCTSDLHFLATKVVVQ